MGYQSVQTRYGLREIAPRMIAGFLAGALSLVGSGIAIQLANALSAAVLANGVDPADGATALRQLIGSSLTAATPGPVPGTGLLIVGLVAAAILQMLLLVYVVRVAITVILIAGAPLALMLHALPQTDGIARWWWRAFAGCLAVQVAQSLTLVATVKVFLTPDGVAGGLFGTVPGSDWARTLVVLALLILLWRIPFWILRAVRGGGSGRSLIGSIVRTAILIKTAGLIGGRSRGSPALLGGGRARRPGFPPGPTGPGARGPRPVRAPARPAGGPAGAVPGGPGGRRAVRASRPVVGIRTRGRAPRGQGQLMLPLGVRRQPRPPAAPVGPSTAAGRRRPAPAAGRGGGSSRCRWPRDCGPSSGRSSARTGSTGFPSTPPAPPAPPRRHPPRGRAGARPASGGGTAAGAAAGPLPRQPAVALRPIPAALRRPRPPPPTPTPHPATAAPAPRGRAAGPPRGRQLRLPLTPPTRTTPPPRTPAPPTTPAPRAATPPRTPTPPRHRPGHRRGGDRPRRPLSPDHREEGTSS